MMQADESAHSPQPTRSDLLRERFKPVIDPIASALNRTGITPNTLTLIGLFGTIIGGLFLARGSFLVGGVIILLMSPLDALDGAMARLRGEPSKFGGLVDSVSDRYSEMSIFGGLLYYYLQRADLLWAGIVFLAACGSFMVSYVRARAEGLGYQAKGGLLTRAERFVVLVPSLILRYPEVGIAIVALLANLTALQRILIVRRQAHS
jgi:CDP-diacylglycerol--glycerol-3-phosphate 3-phosphatidyltransferase